jgi:hypothetical protein
VKPFNGGNWTQQILGDRKGLILCPEKYQSRLRLSNKEKYRRAKENQQEQRERRAAARVVDAITGKRKGPGRPFGAVGGYFKPWMERIIGNFYTDTDLIRDFILLSPKERVQFITELDPKTMGEGSPEEVAARIKAALEAIQKTVPKPE